MATDSHGVGLTTRQRALKRSFDVVVSLVALVVTSPLIVIAIIAARRSTGGSGVIRQERIGRRGSPFVMFKVRTMRDRPDMMTTVTTSHDPRITAIGRILRSTKVDELPQLLNVLKGDMSLVGPRPDVAGFADCLEGQDRLVLSVRPGITGPASLRFRNEEELLGKQADPERYNREVLYPAKVQINLGYVRGWRFRDDLVCLLQTVTRAGGDSDSPG